MTPELAKIIGRLVFAAFIIAIVLCFHYYPEVQPVHAATGAHFDEKFFMSRACPEGHWEVDTIDQDESSVIMRCEEDQ